MTSEQIEVVIVGAGQAGIAMSEHLADRGIAHIVLERDRVAEGWRTKRWDSLVANGPAWHDRFPGRTIDGVEPDGFATKDQMVAYFEAYAQDIKAPVRTGVEVAAVRKREGALGYRVETSAGTIDARHVVAATGPFQLPSIPGIVPDSAGVRQLHSSLYRNPAQLDEGAVLVVGAGSSGVQIADELRRDGRRVYLAVGPHDRPPRSYRGRDFCWWLGVLGLWEKNTPPAGAEHVTIAVSGAHGGRTVDFRELAASGITLVGRANAFENGRIRFGADLAKNVAAGDANLFALLDAADAYVERNGLDLPEEPQARQLLPDPGCLTDPLTELDLVEARVTTIIWATGFRADYSWLPSGALDERGLPAHQRGISNEPGISFLGLPWQSRRGSSFIWGVWHDAKYLADQIAIQIGYDHAEPAPDSQPIVSLARHRAPATAGVAGTRIHDVPAHTSKTGVVA